LFDLPFIGHIYFNPIPSRKPSLKKVSIRFVVPTRKKKAEILLFKPILLNVNDRNRNLSFNLIYPNVKSQALFVAIFTILKIFVSFFNIGKKVFRFSALLKTRKIKAQKAMLLE